MGHQELYTEKRARALVGAHPKLFQHIVETNGIPFINAGRMRLFTPEAVELIRPHVTAWKHRPRLSHRTSVPA